MKRSDIEILAPAGSWESLAAALDAGADAVYFGAGGLNMRARSSANFTLDDLGEIVRRAHAHTGNRTRTRGVKAYLTVNSIIYDDESQQLGQLMDRAAKEKIDAVIASDHAAILAARERGIPVHISTQANISNSAALRFYSQWADTMVLARELTLPQVERIAGEIARQNIKGPDGQPVRIEMFAHGALCMAISGRCYLSAHTTGHSANRGGCMQLCRRGYELRDVETGEQIAIENQRVMSPRDLCTLPFLDRMLAAGVRVLKIEGRARSAEYVRRTTEIYGEAVEAICDDSALSPGDPGRRFTPEWAAGRVERLREVFNRGFWGGYYLGAPIPELTTSYGSSATRRKVYVGRVTNFFKRLSVAEVLIEAAPLESGSEVVVTGETTGAAEIASVQPHVADRPADTAPQGVSCSIHTGGVVLRRGDKLYKIVNA